MVFNAAEGSPTMLPMFQGHVWRHYKYLTDSLPDMVPVLQKVLYKERINNSRNLHFKNLDGSVCCNNILTCVVTWLIKMFF